MAKSSRAERLRAVGAYEGDWPEPSLYAPERLSFTSTGYTDVTHLNDIGENVALCGVGVASMGAEQSMITLLNKRLCLKCLRVLEQRVW